MALDAGKKDKVKGVVKVLVVIVGFVLVAFLLDDVAFGGKLKGSFGDAGSDISSFTQQSFTRSGSDREAQYTPGIVQTSYSSIALLVVGGILLLAFIGGGLSCVFSKGSAGDLAVESGIDVDTNETTLSMIDKKGKETKVKSVGTTFTIPKKKVMKVTQGDGLEQIILPSYPGTVTEIDKSTLSIADLYLQTKEKDNVIVVPIFEKKIKTKVLWGDERRVVETPNWLDYSVWNGSSQEYAHIVFNVTRVDFKRMRQPGNPGVDVNLTDFLKPNPAGDIAVRLKPPVRNMKISPQKIYFAGGKIEVKPGRPPMGGASPPWQDGLYKGEIELTPTHPTTFNTAKKEVEFIVLNFTRDLAARHTLRSSRAMEKHYGKYYMRLNKSRFPRGLKDYFDRHKEFDKNHQAWIRGEIVAQLKKNCVLTEMK